MAAPLLWLNGFPGTGKLTVAKALLETLGDRMIIIDNHQLIDPVAAKFSRDHPDYQHERKLERTKAFKAYVEPAENREKIILCTGTESFLSRTSSF
jgi:adenylylsulfate kinase-like enzyme